MPLQRDVDVVVVGFGLHGAVAALEAANSGARVLALTRQPVAGELQEAARAAGVEVRAGAVAHELVVEDGRIAGVGYAVTQEHPASEDPRRTGTVWPSACDAGPGVPDPEACSDATTIDDVTCSSVVLALDARHWEFVGAAVWSVVRGRQPAQPSSGRSNRLAVIAPDHVPEPVPAEDPELAVRRWCAAREVGPSAAANQRGLQVEESTGVVTTGEQWPVPGLYAAVPAGPGAGADRDIRSVIMAARRAGGAAARRPAGRATLSSVG